MRKVHTPCRSRSTQDAEILLNAGTFPGYETGILITSETFLTSGLFLRFGFLLALATISLVGVACSGCSDRSDFVEPKIQTVDDGFLSLEMGGVKVLLEVAATDHKRGLGLMKRKYLEENQGMLFVHGEPQIMSFYMRDTWIPLSIAFIRDDGTIINIEEMRPNAESPSHLSKGYCRYAIEMNKGWFKDHGIQAGDKITLSPEILNIKAN